MQTLVPIGTFEEKARRLLDDIEYNSMLGFLARHPSSGPVIRGTGGLRKVRIACSGRGKSGGIRVIYYYRNDNNPILLLLIYAKADQNDMTPKQKERLRKLVNEISGNFD